MSLHERTVRRTFLLSVRSVQNTGRWANLHLYWHAIAYAAVFIQNKWHSFMVPFLQPTAAYLLGLLGLSNLPCLSAVPHAQLWNVQMNGGRTAPDKIFRIPAFTDAWAQCAYASVQTVITVGICAVWLLFLCICAILGLTLGIPEVAIAAEPAIKH